MSQARILVMGLMKAEIARVSKEKWTPSYLCKKDCEHYKSHNDHAYLVTAMSQENYLNACIRRLKRYQTTGEIDSQ